MQEDGKYTDKSHTLAHTPLTQLKADALHVLKILAEGYESPAVGGCRTAQC